MCLSRTKVRPDYVDRLRKLQAQEPIPLLVGAALRSGCIELTVDAAGEGRGLRGARPRWPRRHRCSPPLTAVSVFALMLCRNWQWHS
jgi:hypothetical protein